MSNKEESLYDRVKRDLRERRQRVLSGKMNCIPFGFPRFEKQLPGIEQGNYYIITANSKVGKSNLPLYIEIYIANSESYI